MAGCWVNKIRDAGELFGPLYILSIFLLSSWAREKVMRTITNNTTTKFRSDKIFFINRMARNWLQIRILFFKDLYHEQVIFYIVENPYSDYGYNQAIPFSPPLSWRNL